MQTHVRFKVSLFIKSFATSLDRAYEVTISLMLFKMDLESLSSTVRLSTTLVGAFVVFKLIVSFGVIF